MDNCCPFCLDQIRTRPNDSDFFQYTSHGRKCQVFQAVKDDPAQVEAILAQRAEFFKAAEVGA